MFLVVGGNAHAQGAWVGTEKSLTVDLAYQYVPSSAVVLSPDLDVPDRPTRNHIVTLSGDYVPIEKLAVEASLPLAFVRYAGEAIHLPPGKWDDGDYHATLTDLRLGAHYQLLDEPYVALSPHLAVSIPLMDYEVLGFATGGRHLKTVHIGASVGRTLDPWVPNLFFTGSYELSISEKYDATPKTKEISQIRSDVDFQIGYGFFDGRLAVSLGLNWRNQHGGINFEKFAMTDPDLVNHHDPLLNEDFLFLGGNVAYEINEKFTIAVIVRQFVRGYNTRDQDLYGLDLTWNAL